MGITPSLWDDWGGPSPSLREGRGGHKKRPRTSVRSLTHANNQNSKSFKPPFGRFGGHYSLPLGGLGRAFSLPSEDCAFSLPLGGLGRAQCNPFDTPKLTIAPTQANIPVLMISLPSTMPMNAIKVPPSVPTA